MNKEYYRYLDEVLVRSNFRFDILKNGATILLKKFPELKDWKNASVVVREWVFETNPYDRLESNQEVMFKNND